MAFGEVRGTRLVLESVQDDDAACQAVLDEIGDCPECLRCMVRLLAGMVGSVAVDLAEAYGGDTRTVVQQLELQLATAVDKLP